MRAFAERHFALSAVDEAGTSYRATLEGLLHRSRNPDRRAHYEAELQCPPMPAALAYLFEIFMRLRRRCGSTGFALNPVGWPDIDAFMRSTRTRLVSWEIEIVEMLDDVYRVAMAPRKSAGSES